MSFKHYEAIETLINGYKKMHPEKSEEELNIMARNTLVQTVLENEDQENLSINMMSDICLMYPDDLEKIYDNKETMRLLIRTMAIEILRLKIMTYQS